MAKKGSYLRTKEIRIKNSLSNLKLYEDKSNHPRFGIPHSEETKQKISLANSGIRSSWYGRKHTLEWRNLMSLKQRGEDSPNWRGGVTSEQMKVRNSIEYRLWREAIYARDNWVCQECGKRGGKLHAHHIKSFAKNPELRLAIDNGITLCVPCHSDKKGHSMLTRRIYNEQSRCNKKFIR